MIAKREDERGTTGQLILIRGVHWSGWVKLRGFFDPTYHGGSKKIQPNPTHHISPTQLIWVRLGRVEPMGLTNFFIIIIKLSRKKYKY